MVIRPCPDFAVFDAELVIILTAKHICNIKACAELNTLYGRNTEYYLRNSVFNAVKHRRTYACRKSDRRIFDNSAYRIELCRRTCYNISHLLLNVGVDKRKIAASDLL